MLDYSFYDSEELSVLGFKSLGANVQISKAACIIGSENISIDDNSRIDAFTLLSGSGGHIVIGRNVHIASFVSLIGRGGIVLGDFSGLSHGVRVFSASDDYSGEYMTNPTIEPKFTNIHEGEIRICEHVIIGANTVILPGVEIATGTAVGAQSLVTKSLSQWGIYSGIPARLIKPRSKGLLKYIES